MTFKEFWSMRNSFKVPYDDKNRSEEDRALTIWLHAQSGRDIRHISATHKNENVEAHIKAAAHCISVKLACEAQNPEYNYEQGIRFGLAMAGHLKLDE